MKRSMLQVYIHGSDRAVPFYQKAFHAELVSSYPNPDGTYYHSELDVYGQILAVSELTVTENEQSNETVTGNSMQFCLHFGEGQEETVWQVYEVLKEGATVLYPLSPCEYSSLLVDLIDQFGVRWCIFA